MECVSRLAGFSTMGLVIFGMLAMVAVTALAARLTRNAKRQSCCIIVDPAKDLRMTGAFESQADADS